MSRELTYLITILRAASTQQKTVGIITVKTTTREKTVVSSDKISDEKMLK